MSTVSTDNAARDVPWLESAAFHGLIGTFVGMEIATGVALQQEKIWLLPVFALVTSHLMHGMLIGLHEASHGRLRSIRYLNDFAGVAIGVLGLTSFSLFRSLHQLHHAHFASERDEEFWPFVHPGIARWKRVMAAILELTMGLLYTPLLLARAFLRQGSTIRNKRVRGRIWAELALMILVWGSVFAVCAVQGGWKWLLWLYVIPAWLAGNMQSLRKFIEHVGLTSSTLNGSTRSIISEGWLGRLICLSLLHEPYHGVHHWRPSVPYPELPANSEVLEPTVADELPPFRSFGAAFLHLLPTLADPRVGPQWVGGGKVTRMGAVGTPPVSMPEVDGHRERSANA